MKKTILLFLSLLILFLFSQACSKKRGPLEVVDNTSTPTRTDTVEASTATYTCTNTPTGTASATTTATNSFTSTATYTFTWTSTMTTVPSNTNTPTASSTSTSLHTATNTVTVTGPTLTFTHTPTNTSSNTAPATSTPTPVLTSTETPSLPYYGYYAGVAVYYYNTGGGDRTAAIFSLEPPDITWMAVNVDGDYLNEMSPGSFHGNVPTPVNYVVGSVTSVSVETSKGNLTGLTTLPETAQITYPATGSQQNYSQAITVFWNYPGNEPQYLRLSAIDMDTATYYLNTTLTPDTTQYVFPAGTFTGANYMMICVTPYNQVALDSQGSKFLVHYKYCIDIIP
jgi:hypothetical protein